MKVDAKTRFSFTGEIDDYGQALETLSVAVPRGKDPLTGNSISGAPVYDASEDYYVVFNTMSYIVPTNESPYIMDRVKESLSEELLNTSSQDIWTIRSNAFSGGGTKRVLGHELNFYDGSSFQGESFGEIGNFGLLVRTEKLSITSSEVNDIYNSNVPPCFSQGSTPDWQNYPGGFSSEIPADDLGYAYHDGNTAPYLEGYYAQGDAVEYDFQSGGASSRGMVVAMRDVYSRETTIEYDTYFMLPTQVTNVFGLQVNSENNYRVLAPFEINDINNNLSRVTYNELGLLTSTILLGKNTGNEGDTSAKPSVLFEYDFHAFIDSGTPIYVKKTSREHHANADYIGSLPSGAANDTIVSTEYSDGYGRIVQSRAQAEDVIYGDAQLGDSGLSADMSVSPGDATATERGGSDPLNVVVSGKKRYNNKGEVVEQYEPFFDSGFDFQELGTQPGEAIKMFYDAPGRLIKTISPDDSEQRVYYGTFSAVDDLNTFAPTPWQKFSYDANDLAGITHPSGNVPSSHYYTPKSETIDALGRVIETTDHQAHFNGSSYEDVTLKYTYDTKGQLLEVENANQVLQTTNKYDTAGNHLYADNIDRGTTLITVDAKSMPYLSFDAKGAETLSLYDELDRPSRLWAKDESGGTFTIRSATEYGINSGQSNPEDENLYGKPYAIFDGAGRTLFKLYDFKGNILEKNRQVFKDDILDGQGIFRPDWSTLNDTNLDSKEYITAFSYDALNRPFEVLYPEDTSGNRKKLASTFNKAGALQKLQLASTEWVSHIAYNAKGQKIMSVNGSLFTRYVYDDKTFRLVRIRASKFNKSGNTYSPISGIRLDRGYTHDLMGSVVEIHDITPKNQWAQGPGNLTRQFTHDPLRRLISATGRESTGAIPAAAWRLDTQPEDHSATNTYTRNYSYDKQGNILELQHIANGHSANNFTRTYNYANGFTTNKLEDFTVGSNTFSYNYDGNGNMIKENSERYFEWNFADKLAFFKNQAGGGNPSVWVHYLYDNEGNRVKKIVNKQGGIQEVTVYIDKIFEHTYIKNSGTIDANRHYNTMHVLEGTSRVATLRVGTDTDDSTPAQKYFVEDHLGNCSVTVQTNGARINMEEYYPFGQTSFGSFAKKRYRYNGKEKDEHTGLYEYGQRYYAPWLCRFVSVDPIAEDYPQLSSYNYAGNKPITSPDIEGLQGTQDSELKNSNNNANNSRTFRTPSGESFRATGIHNISTANGESEVLTTAGVLVPTRTSALLQFDFQGENYKAHFDAETLEFTNYKTEDGKVFPLEGKSGQYSAELLFSVEETSKGILTFSGLIYGNEDWVWNETYFSFNVEINFDTENGFNLETGMYSIPTESSLESDFIGKIYFNSLDDDLPGLLENTTVEYIENNIGSNKNYVSLNTGLDALKIKNEEFKTVVGAVRYSLSVGFREASKLQDLKDAISNINPTPYDFRLSSGQIRALEFSNLPSNIDSMSLGMPIKRR